MAMVDRELKFRVERKREVEGALMVDRVLRIPKEAVASKIYLPTFVKLSKQREILDSYEKLG